MASETMTAGLAVGVSYRLPTEAEPLMHGTHAFGTVESIRKKHRAIDDPRIVDERMLASSR